MNPTHLSIVWFAAITALTLSSALPAVSAHGDGIPLIGDPHFLVYVGSYTGPKSKGIYVMRMDPKTGALSKPELAGEVPSPSFLAIHPTEKFLYAVSELDGKDGGGIVSAFSIAKESGQLTLLNQQTAGGSGTCFVGLNPAGTTALIANYGSGSVEALPIEENGQLSKPTAFIQDVGKSVDSKRQENPHAHSFNVDAAGRFAFAADLGLDKLFVYKLDGAKGTLTPNDPPFVQITSGSGPRHFTFHPNGDGLHLRCRQGRLDRNPDDPNPSRQHRKRQQHGRGAGASFRQIPLWLQSWRQFDFHLHDRRTNRKTDLRRNRKNDGEDAA